MSVTRLYPGGKGAWYADRPVRRPARSALTLWRRLGTPGVRRLRLQFRAHLAKQREAARRQAAPKRSVFGRIKRALTPGMGGARG